MNGSSNEYAWLAYDWMKGMSCFAVRVVGLIRLEFAVDVEGRINCKVKSSLVMLYQVFL